MIDRKDLSTPGLPGQANNTMRRQVRTKRKLTVPNCVGSAPVQFRFSAHCRVSCERKAFPDRTRLSSLSRKAHVSDSLLCLNILGAQLFPLKLCVGILGQAVFTASMCALTNTRMWSHRKPHHHHKSYTQTAG